MQPHEAWHYEATSYAHLYAAIMQYLAYWPRGEIISHWFVE